MFSIHQLRSSVQIVHGASSDGTGLGFGVTGGFVGLSVGLLLGSGLGSSVGSGYGADVGDGLGFSVGFLLGFSVGFLLGSDVGSAVGSGQEIMDMFMERGEQELVLVLFKLVCTKAA